MRKFLCGTATIATMLIAQPASAGLVANFSGIPDTVEINQISIAKLTLDFSGIGFTGTTRAAIALDGFFLTSR